MVQTLRRIYIPKQRGRIQGERIPSNVAWTATSPGNPTQNFTSPARDSLQSRRATNDYVNTGYFSRVKSGEVINSPYATRMVTSRFPTGAWQVLRTSNVTSNIPSSTDALFIARGVGNSPNLDPPDYSKVGFSWILPEVGAIKSDPILLDLATIAARSNVVKADSLALVTLAELRKTGSMIVNAQRSFSSATELILQGKSKRAVLELLGVSNIKRSDSFWKSSLRGGLNRWLEVRYGWMPIVYDIQGTLKALNAQHTERFTARGFASDSAASTTSDSWLYAGAWTNHFQVVQGMDKQFRAFILYTVKKDGFLLQKLGLLQLPETIWELVRFSFVIDHFVDIGSWLNAITPRIGVNVLAEGYTVKKAWDYERTISSISIVGGSGITSVPGLVGQSDGFSVLSKDRATGLPAFPLPRVNVKYNAAHVVDAIALLVQQFKRLR
jgi:hypothetical protein